MADEGDLQVDDKDYSPTVPATSALLDEQKMVDEGDNHVDPKPSQPPYPLYAELLWSAKPAG